MGPQTPGSGVSEPEFPGLWWEQRGSRAGPGQPGVPCEAETLAPGFQLPGPRAHPGLGRGPEEAVRVTSEVQCFLEAKKLSPHRTDGWRVEAAEGSGAQSRKPCTKGSHGHVEAGTGKRGCLEDLPHALAFSQEWGQCGGPLSRLRLVLHPLDAGKWAAAVGPSERRGVWGLDRLSWSLGFRRLTGHSSPHLPEQSGRPSPVACFLLSLTCLRPGQPGPAACLPARPTPPGPPSAPTHKPAHGPWVARLPLPAPHTEAGTWTAVCECSTQRPETPNSSIHSLAYPPMH